MKKLIALLLVLALCLGVLVACNDSEKMRAEIESEIRAEIESEIRTEIEAEERAKREKTYTFYRLEVECNPDIFKTNGLYCEYDGFYNFFRDFYEAGNTEINNITRNTFQDYYVLCVRVGNLLYRGKNASYNNLRLEISDSSTSIYSIDYCADYYPGMYFIVENDLYSKTGFHLVLIPKEDVPAPNTPDIFVHKVLTISSEEQSTSTEGPILEESSSPSEEPAEIVYYDEIKGFILKDDAPEFKLCKSYNELLAMLEAPLQNFDENIFEGNYVLMIKNAIYSGASGYLGFANLSLEENELTIEWHLQAVNGRDYTAEEHYMNALIVLPKADINGLPEKVVVSPKYNKINNDSEIVKSFR